MKVSISARRLKALESAENCARAFRTMITAPVCAPDEQAQRLALDWLGYWLEIAPKNKYELPPDVPKRWKYNRDQAMRGWPDKKERKP